MMNPVHGYTRHSIRWLITAVVLLFLGHFAWSNWQRIRVLDFDVRLAILALSMAVLAVHFLGRALLWHFLTTRYRIDISLTQSVGAWFLSQLGKYIPGKVFMYFGRLFYYARHGRSKTLFSICFAVETMATILSSTLVVMIALANVGIPELQPYEPLLLLTLVGLVAALHPTVLRKLASLVLRALGRSPIDFIPRGRDTAIFVALYSVNWLVFGWAFFLFINSIYRIGTEHILYLAGSFSAASLIAMFGVFVPSGLGVREGVLIFMLAPVVSVEAAIVVSFASRLWFTATELTGVGASWIFMRGLLPPKTELDTFAATS
ncbi:MAG: lysylphosphatidylglycerol synthase domain-containing protein [Gammaproteobacteria bacterium]